MSQLEDQYEASVSRNNSLRAMLEAATEANALLNHRLAAMERLTEQKSVPQSSTSVGGGADNSDGLKLSQGSRDDESYPSREGGSELGRETYLSATRTTISTLSPEEFKFRNSPRVSTDRWGLTMSTDSFNEGEDSSGAPAGVTLGSRINRGPLQASGDDKGSSTCDAETDASRDQATTSHSTAEVTQESNAEQRIENDVRWIAFMLVVVAYFTSSPI